MFPRKKIVPLEWVLLLIAVCAMAVILAASWAMAESYEDYQKEVIARLRAKGRLDGNLTNFRYPNANETTERMTSRWLWNYCYAITEGCPRLMEVTSEGWRGNPPMKHEGGEKNVVPYVVRPAPSPYPSFGGT